MAGTTKVLTPAMVKKYVEGGGAECPFCGSAEIEAGHVVVDGDSVTAPVECLTCGAEWRDVFFLSAVDVLDENGRYDRTIWLDNRIATLWVPIRPARITSCDTDLWWPPPDCTARIVLDMK